MFDAVLAQLIARLVPIFLNAAHGDEQQAHDAARGLLMSFNPSNEAELPLVGQIITNSFGSIDNVALAMADPGLTHTERLHYYDNAQRLSRAAERAQRALDKRRAAPTCAKPRAEAPDAAPTDLLRLLQAMTALPAADDQDSTGSCAPDIGEHDQPLLAPEASHQATEPAPEQAVPARPISRQERRHLARMAEKERLANARATEKAGRLAALNAGREDRARAALASA